MDYIIKYISYFEYITFQKKYTQFTKHIIIFSYISYLLYLKDSYCFASYGHYHSYRIKHNKISISHIVFEFCGQILFQFFIFYFKICLNFLQFYHMSGFQQENRED